ncbi:kinesin-like protein KIF28P isoform X2 [Mercenaria mercenaria]|uniref:kinesin-like protein KIF28P isoform X2 n=1 Tax=Mercenaria mercenaria TaxID=6596 RepID=UPI00234F9247|nr:kinesin-like protein KIF28P isoform X2 [Mercenaria mercenaria]
MSEENVKVAVRVRPFNGRERDRNAVLIIEMSGATTKIIDPSGSNEEKKFTFDYSYWSHDGCKDNGTGYFAPDTSSPNGKKFADQQKVFDELGVGVLNNAWEGYNSTLFAYGQTGSGKSWSMVGYDVNKGIVPLYCEQLFKGIEKKVAEGAKSQYEVTFTMLEIYNENCRDLLDSSGSKSALRVRQHPKSGFYADGLNETAVGSYQDIEQKMAEGTRNRTVASTKMNATSSRAHTIVCIKFVQKSVNDAGEEMAKTSEVNLVDLAGSERADSTGATGDRLKEGAAINQSLSSLGNCIAALADQASGKKTRVPYRNSVLTKLLKNALGGNSKTIMIAALSPADINYDETLSTLRYADRAKQIKCSAKVNEDPTAALIRELQEENEKLKAMLSSGKVDMSIMEGEDTADMTDEERAEMKKELEDEYKSMLEKNKKDMENMEAEFQKRLEEAKANSDYQSIAEINERKKTDPHLYNLNMDPMMTGRIIHFMNDDKEVIIGNGKAEGTDLVLRGGSIIDVHCKIMENNGVYTLETFPNAKTLRNGKSVTAETKTLKHHDRLVFGTTQFFVFCNPKDKSGCKVENPDFEMAQAEIATKSGGFDMSGQNKSRDEAILQQDLLEIMPGVEEANSISEALEKRKRFDLVIVSPEARGELTGRTEVMVKMTDIDTKHEWMWNRQIFLDRKCIMSEMFDKYEDGLEWQRPQDKDPFWEDPKADFHIGSVKMWLQSISYMIESSETLDITDFKGSPVGKMTIGVFPCDPKGKEFTDKDDKFVEDPNTLVGKNIDFKVKITNARGLPNKYTDVYCKYKVYLEDKYTQTKAVKDTTNPDYNHERVISLPGTQETVDFLKTGAFIVQIWGKQKDHKPKGGAKVKAGGTGGAGVHAVNTNQQRFDPEKVKYMMEVGALKKRQEKMELKLVHMRRMIEVAEEHHKRKVSTKLIKDIYHAPTNDQAEKCIALIPLEKGRKQ